MNDRIRELCGQAKAGDPTAASELIGLFYEKVFAYFRRLCGNDADAADLTQKSFLKVWSALNSYEGRSSFSTWLHGIAHHVYVDWMRKTNRLNARPIEWWNEQESGDLSPFDSVAEHDLACRLYEEVDALEEPNRETVHLHYYQGLSLNETGEALGVATSTVKYRLKQSLAILRRGLAERKEFANKT